MVKIPDRVEHIIDQFIKELERNDIPVEKAFLYGSYATGTYDEWSDIDLAIVSRAFEGNRFNDRCRIRSIKLAISSDLEPLPYHPDDFNAGDPFIEIICETGVLIEKSEDSGQ